jgi:RNA polymerase sigma-70 factor (ECF subfamily)
VNKPIINCGGENVFDSLYIRGVVNKNERALETVIDKYSAYVCTIARNTLGQSVSHEDIEEIASDVFLALWENAGNIRNDSLKAYLGRTAHNMAVNRLRSICETLPLEEAAEVSENADVLETVISDEERRLVQNAILSMESPDREIFIRYYYNSETAADVAVNTGLTEAAVKHRLSRGRQKLRQNIVKEGYILE